jgi:hypothetical protein
MNRIAMLSTTLVAVLAAMPVPMPAEAADDGAILRCVSPDGTVGYTDRSCAVFGAQSVPMDPDLAARIASDRAYAADFASDGYDVDDAYGAPGDAAEGFDATSATLVQPVAGRRSPASGCARNPAQLANDLEASVALGDVNRIAESYHFAGMSTAAGERVLDRLQQYAGRVVVESRYFGGIRTVSPSMATDGMASDGTLPDATAWNAGGTPMVRLVLAGNDGRTASSLDLDVERYAGCYFVRFA